MIAKPFKGGRTPQGADKTIAYLLNERVKEGLALVLKGDAELTKRLIKEASKKFKWSWSSGVLSFSETLDDDTKREIIADFERVFFAGLSQEQFNILWVNHEDKDRTEMHYIAPRLELSTQKSFNPYFVKRDFNKKDLWQEKINIEYGLSSHLDNLKAVKEFKAEWVKDKKSLLRQIDEKVIALIKSGDIDSRNDIIDYLRQSFELGNIDNKFLTIIADEGKKHRLKGAMYSKDFTDLKSLWKAREAKSRVTVNGTQRELKALEKAINEIVEKQAYGNRKKYGTPVPEKSVQIVSGVIKLEPRPLKIDILEDKSESAPQTDEEQKNTKKEQDEQDKRDKSEINRILRESREGESRRKKRISESIRTATALHDSIRKSVTDAYKDITEALEIGAERRALEEDFKHTFLIIDGNIGEIQRGLIGRNNTVEQGLNQHNSRVIEAIELIRNKLSEKVVVQARLRNTEARVRNNEKKLGWGKTRTI